MSTALVEVRTAVEKMAPQFKAALPAHIPVERFVRTTLTAVQTNPDLMEADRRTLFAAATRAAQMGLLPDGREGAIVTFNGKCSFMPMLGGILKLVRNSGELASIDAQIVYKADKFTYRPGIDLVPQHEPDWFGDRGEVVGVYAVAKMKDGAAYVEILSKKQVEQVRAVSRSRNAGPWSTWWDEMARKTAIRRLAKRLPLSTDLDGVVHEDDELFMPPEQPAAPAQPPADPLRNRGQEFSCGRVTYLFDGAHLWYVLPSGRVLCYPFARFDEEGNVTYAKASWKPAADAKEWPRARLWRGLACENITQAVANDLLRHSLRRLDGMDLKVVLTVHDEIVLEVEKSKADWAAGQLVEVMCTVPDWCFGLPLNAEVAVMERYGK